jgi:hypothetical protein
MAGFERDVANQKLVVFLFDTSTGAAKTGEAASIVVYNKELGATLQALADTTATELSSTNAPGYYELDISNTELNTAYTYFFPRSTTANTGAVVVMPAFTIPAGFSAGTGQVALATGGITNTTFAAGAINAAAIATGAIDADAIASDAVSEIQTDLLKLSTALPGSPTADTVGNALKNASLGIPASAPGAAGGLPLYDDLFSVVAEGTLGTVTSAGDMLIVGSFATTDDFYNGMFMVPQSGNAAHQPRAISDYTGATKRCQFLGTGAQLSRPFSATPTIGDPIKILGLSGTI